MPRIAEAFSIQPPIHLIKEFENIVVFPNESSGKFTPSALLSGALYEVHGSTLTELTPSTTLRNPPTPFGAYSYSKTPALQSQFHAKLKANKENDFACQPIGP